MWRHINKAAVFLLYCFFSCIVLLISSCHTVKKTQKNFDTIIDSSDATGVQDTASLLHFATPGVQIPNGISDTANMALRNKYAKMLGINPSDIHNIKLYKFIDEWLGTPYLWGGTTKKGIDCSAFVQKLYDYVYDIHIPRTSIEQFFTNDVESFGSARYLSEGDMVFFKTIKGTLVSHVGFYLGNHKFVNASSHGGVCIGDLTNPYWSEKFVVAGRIRYDVQNSSHQ